MLKSDVWSSSDGITWTLVTPGCRAPQFDLVASGNAHERKFGTEAYACKVGLACRWAMLCVDTYSAFISTRLVEAVVDYRKTFSCRTIFSSTSQSNTTMTITITV